MVSGMKKSQGHGHRFPRRLVGHNPGSGGFALIEILVAITVLAMVMVAGGAVLGTQMETMSSTRSAQGADGILTQALSEIRALPYSTVEAGLSNTVSSPYITKSGTTWTFVDHSARLAGQGNGEQIPHASSPSKAPAPFYPDPTTSHVVNGTRMTVLAVPTFYTAPPPGTPHGGPVVVPGVIRITVIVSWSGHGGHTSSTTIVGQTLVYSSGTGCLSGVSNPFAAPCRPNSVSSAALSDGVITVRPGAAAVASQASTTTPTGGTAAPKWTIAQTGFGSYGAIVGDPYGYAATCSTPSLCVMLTDIGGAPTGLSVWNGSTWTNPAGFEQLYFHGVYHSAISCVGASWCMAGTYGGNYLIDTAGTWSTPVNLAGKTIPVLGISCTSSSWCKAVSKVGAVYTWTGTTWTATALLGTTATHPGDEAISCATPTFCAWSDGSTVKMWNGSTWVKAAVGIGASPFISITCSAQSQCMAVTLAGSAFQFGGNSWSGPVTTGLPATEYISCSNPTWCVASGDNTPTATVHSGTVSIWNGSTWTLSTKTTSVSGFTFTGKVLCAHGPTVWCNDSGTTVWPPSKITQIRTLVYAVPPPPSHVKIGPLQGVTFTTITLNLPSAHVYDNFLQTSSVSGWASATGAALTTAGSTSLSRTLRMSTTASDDPASPFGKYEHTAATSTLTGLSASGKNTATKVNSITATPSSGDAVSSTSTVAAKSGQTCVNEVTVVLKTDLPCGIDKVTPESAASITASMYAGATSLGSPVPLVSVGAPTPAAATTAFSYVVPRGTGTCPKTATSVCVDSGGRVNLGTTSFDGLPSAMSGSFPAGWSTTKNLVSLSHYSASASSSMYGHKSTHKGSHTASLGSGSTAPTITVWIGSGYASLKLTAVSGSFQLPKFTVTDASFPGGPLTVTIVATVTISPPATSAKTHAGCVVACSETAAVPSVTVNSTYEVTQGSSVIADLDITAALGSASTSSSYQAAS